MAGVNRMYDKWDSIDPLLEEKEDYIKDYVRNHNRKAKEFHEREEFLGIKTRKGAADSSDRFCQTVRKPVAVVTCGTTKLKLTITQKFLDRPFVAAVIEPFLGAYNKKRPDETPLTFADLAGVRIDEKAVDNVDVRCSDLLPKEQHTVTLLLPQAEEEEEAGLELEDNAEGSVV